MCQLIQELLEEYLYAMERLNGISGITTPETLIKSKPVGAAYTRAWLSLIESKDFWLLFL